MNNLFDKIDIHTDAVPMEILDLEGKPLVKDEALKPVIVLYGRDSNEFKEAAKNINEGDSLGTEKLLASCVQSWRNILNDEGQPIEANAANAVALFKRYPIVLSQVDQAVLKRANYLKNA